MKIKLLYLFVVIIIVIIGVIFFFNWQRSCWKWKKPANVPISAIWKGGCDGGNWMELVDIKIDTMRFRIYHDWNGDLLLDADFVSEKCNDLQLTKINWSEYITGFDGTAIHTTILSDNVYCRLVPVYPAYYEEKIK